MLFIIAEREWRKQKSEYESYIMTLEAERDARSRHDGMVKVTFCLFTFIYLKTAFSGMSTFDLKILLLKYDDV